MTYMKDVSMHTKDVTTHTRAMKLKHQDLQDKLEKCLLELKKVCIREAVSKSNRPVNSQNTCHKTNESRNLKLIEILIKALADLDKIKQLLRN